MKRSAKAGWIALVVLAATNGLQALRYVLPVVPFPARLDNFFHHRFLLGLHAFSGAIALLAGPLQLMPAFRERHWAFHRRVGWIYSGAVGVGSVAALGLAVNADTGRVAAMGFFFLGLSWLMATALAVNFILRADSARHRRWMIRSYCLTAAAITLRIYLPLSLVLHVRYAIAYPAIAWLCWIPNLLAAELYLRRAAESPQSAENAPAPL